MISEATCQADVLLERNVLQRWRIRELASSVLAAEDIERVVDRHALRSIIQRILISTGLSVREQYIIRELYGLNGHHCCLGYATREYGAERHPLNPVRYCGPSEGRFERSIDCLAAELGVCRQRVYQIEAKTLRKLRHPTRSRLLKVFIDGCEHKPQPLPLVSCLPPVVKAYHSLLLQYSHLNTETVYQETIRHYDALIQIRRRICRR